jgi:hypothetical protein
MSRAKNNDNAIRGGSRRSEVAWLLQGVWRIQGAGVKCAMFAEGVGVGAGLALRCCGRAAMTKG